MHISMRPRPEVVAAGRRFAVRLTRESFPVDPARENFVILRGADERDGVLTAVDEDGGTWTSADERRGFRRADGLLAKLAWTLPLPNSVDAADYVTAHLHPGQPFPRWSSNRPALLLVKSVEDGTARCVALAATDGGRTFSLQWPDTLRLVDDHFSPGDLLVAARLVEGMDDDGAVFSPYQHGVITRSVPEDAVDGFLPEEGGIQYANSEDYAQWFLVAQESVRPDECLVEFHEPSRGVKPSVLAWSGREIASQRRCRIEDNFHNGERPAGIWVFEDIQFEMDFDADDQPAYYWSGEFRAATADDLLRHGLPAVEAGDLLTRSI